MIQKVLSQASIERDPSAIPSRDFLEVQNKIGALFPENPAKTTYISRKTERSIVIDDTGISLKTSIQYIGYDIAGEEVSAVSFTSIITQGLESSESQIDLTIVPSKERA